MDAKSLQDVLDFAVDAARAAGELTLRYFQTALTVETKTDNSPVTVADRGAEELLRERISKAFPDHGILGEEFGETTGREAARWILDPIDGTVSFISGVPLYCVLIGFEFEGRMLAGVIHMPALRETVYAARGLGCRWNEREAHASDVSELSRARLLYGGSKALYVRGRGRAFERLRDRCYADRAWSDGYAYALVATGRAEIVLDPIMNIWDTAALLPVVTEAGGTLTDWNGQSDHTASAIVATNGKLFGPVMTAVQT